MQFSDIFNLENEIKKKNTVFINVNAIKQQKMKFKLSFLTIMNLKNKIIKKCQQYYANLSFMKSV